MWWHRVARGGTEKHRVAHDGTWWHMVARGGRQDLAQGGTGWHMVALGGTW